MEDINLLNDLIDVLPPGACDAVTVYMVMSEAKFGQRPKAVGFSDDEYYASLQFIPYVEKQLDRITGVIRKKPENDQMKICVDEWGCWHDTGKESNWCMRTTMRDAVIAAATLNTFNNKCDIIEMAALCMTINALHSILLTQGNQMVKSPTYYVFRQYREHQGARQVYSFVEQDSIPAPQLKVPRVSHSVSVKDGRMLISLVNCSATEPVQLNSTLLDSCFTHCEGEVLSADPRSENTFSAPNEAVTQAFHDFALAGQQLTITLPPCSVTTLSLWP